MTLRWVKTPNNVATKIRGGIPGTEREGVIWSDSFREITPGGKVVWEWLGYEHFNPETDTICPLCPRAEWTHLNSCFVLPNGDILTSSQKVNTVAIIDKSSGALKWLWGKEELAHPHNPSMLSNGNILVFDNGAHRLGTPVGLSRVLEVDLNGQIIWEFREESPLHYYSPFISGCQRLPNGNTLICEGAIGRFIEVTSEKEVVWEYICPFYSEKNPAWGLSNLVFRAHRYGPDFEGLKGKDLLGVTISKQRIVESRLKALGY